MCTWMKRRFSALVYEDEVIAATYVCLNWIKFLGTTSSSVTS